jgi:hypothetical protein
MEKMKKGYILPARQYMAKPFSPRWGKRRRSWREYNLRNLKKQQKNLDELWELTNSELLRLPPIPKP